MTEESKKLRGMNVEGFLKSVTAHADAALEALECGTESDVEWHVCRLCDEAEDIKALMECGNES